MAGMIPRQWSRRYRRTSDAPVVTSRACRPRCAQLPPGPQERRTGSEAVLALVVLGLFVLAVFALTVVAVTATRQ